MQRLADLEAMMCTLARAIDHSYACDGFSVESVRLNRVFDQLEREYCAVSEKLKSVLYNQSLGNLQRTSSFCS
jgi:hypothetical protein